ncbi:DUF6878 family protein [Tistrella mobilis]|uniref:DUF6878 domain-containing protein n=1 Tax=Tistrella mobilis (strain KA081020-065) TaxID=1110502 RepID=I3TMS3_TISMK|nr:DUF6878 family protein [Tistrella mobilis]AFK54061.1 hypothetical protein TMO_2223 [Tistrella mobilis KA081020-065]
MTDTTQAAASAPTISPDYSAYLAREAERDRLAAELLPANKAALFGALEAAGIVIVLVTFDGCGDSGQIESVEARDAHNNDVALPADAIEIAKAPWEGTEPERQRLPVHGAIEEMAYRFLEQTHGGWEDNEGAYGEFTFDVAARTITLEYNERFIDTEYSEHEF